MLTYDEQKMPQEWAKQSGKALESIRQVRALVINE